MTLTLGRDFGRRPKLDEVLVERTEQVERKFLRERDLALRQKETQAGGLRQDFVERFFVERVVDDRAPRDGRYGRPERHDGTPPAGLQILAFHEDLASVLLTEEDHEVVLDRVGAALEPRFRADNREALLVPAIG